MLHCSMVEDYVMTEEDMEFAQHIHNNWDLWSNEDGWNNHEGYENFVDI